MLLMLSVIVIPAAFPRDRGGSTKSAGKGDVGSMPCSGRRHAATLMMEPPKVNEVSIDEIGTR